MAFRRLLNLGLRLREKSIRRKSRRKKQSLLTNIVSASPRISLSNYVFVESPTPVAASGNSTKRLAIQQHDNIHDAIVISTLPHYPFCCHEDLVTMSRSQLLGVAGLFNSHLPINAQIVILESSRAKYIRNCIEHIVGIVPTASYGFNQQSGRRNSKDIPFHGMSSPARTLLTTHASQTQGVPSELPRALDILVEEDEEDFPTVRKTLKN